MPEPILGILGGMGPEATIELFWRIVASTPARTDQEHLHLLIDNDPKIPNRTAAILGEGEDPLPRLAAAARRLEAGGAGCLVIPCNTAHHWLPALREAVGIPILDMIAETAGRIAALEPRPRIVGLLATTGTIRTGLYQTALGKHEIDVITPDEPFQAQVMEAIERIKAKDHDVKAGLLSLAGSLIDRGAGAVIPGCTELSLLIGPNDLPCPVIDPLSILAQVGIAWAQGQED
jgi:aspartate racemase